MPAGVGVWAKVGEGRLGGDGLWDPQELWGRGKEGCSWCSFEVQGMRLEDWVWENRDDGENLWAANLHIKVL